MKKVIEEANRIARKAKVPDGWTSKTLEGTGFGVVSANNGARFMMATIDGHARAVSIGGYVTHGKVDASEMSFTGRGWQQKLVDAAVAKLQEVARG